jgi:hypothetical protein
MQHFNGFYKYLGSSGEALNQGLTISYAWIISKKFLIVKQWLINNCNLGQQTGMAYFIWAYGKEINKHAKIQHFSKYRCFHMN